MLLMGNIISNKINTSISSVPIVSGSKRTPEVLSGLTSMEKRFDFRESRQILDEKDQKPYAEVCPYAT